MGPNDPIGPTAQDAEGRAWDFPVGYNLGYVPKSDEGISFWQLRALADLHPIVRLAIQTRKDQMVKLRWGIRKVGAKPFEEPDETCKKVIAQLMEPEVPEPGDIPTHTWSTWLRALLDDMMVIDAMAVYPRRTVAPVGGGAGRGEVFSLEVVDAATMRKVINDLGRTPGASETMGDGRPVPAYVQRLKGLPAVFYQQRDLCYWTWNPRSDHVYGLSPVEQIAIYLNMGIRRNQHVLEFYTRGSMADVYLALGEKSTWGSSQVTRWLNWFAKIYGGNTSKRRSTPVILPPGASIQNPKEAVLKDDFDEWTARIVCYCLGLNPQAFIRMMNRNTAETAKDEALEEGKEPYKKAVAEYINRLIRYYILGVPGYEFYWHEELLGNAYEKAQADDIRQKAGEITINEVRAGRGLPRVDGGDTAYVLAGNTIIRVEDLPTYEPPAPTSPFGADPGAPPDPEDDPDRGADPLDEEKEGPTDAEKEERAVKTFRAHGYKGRVVRRVTSPTARHEVSRIAERMRVFLRDQAAPIAAQVVAALRASGLRALGDPLDAAASRAEADRVVRELDLSGWSVVIGGMTQELSEATRSAGAVNLASVGVDDRRVVGRVDAESVAYARRRGAELVGKRWTEDGRLVDSPNARMRIDEGTREKLRGVIASGLEEGVPVDELEAHVAASGAFTPARARAIAETEVAFANSAGSRAAWEESGVVLARQAILSDDHRTPDDCDEAADQGPVPLDQAYRNGKMAPPFHTLCQCDEYAVLEAGA